MPTRCDVAPETVNDLDAQVTTATPADRLALAQAVAADPTDRVRLIDAANGSPGFAPLSQAVADGSAFALRVSPRLLAIDADDPGHGYVRLLSLLQALYVPTVELASGGAAHRRHLWVVIGELPAVLRTQLEQAVRSLGLDVRAGGSLIRPPLTPHRNGSMPTLLSPVSAAQAVSVLSGEGCGSHRAQLLVQALSGSPVEPPTPPRSTWSSGVRSVTPQTADLIRYGDQTGRYHSRSEAQYAACMGLANAGVSETEAVALLLVSAVGGKARDQRDPAGWLGADYRRAQAQVARTPAVRDITEARAEADRLAQVAAVHRWERGLGVAPATIGRVLGAVLRVCGEAGRLSEVSVSVRQVADRAGVGRSPAMRALGVLVETGTLRLDRRAQGPSAAIYTVERSAAPFVGGERRGTLSHTPPRGISSVPLTSPPLHPDHDGWRHGALGGSALRIAGLLSDEPVPARQVAAAVGSSVRWVQVLLARLGRFGLAVQTPDGWVLGASETRRASLEAAAEQLGTRGRGDLQRQRHALERAGWLAHLDRLAQARVDRLGDPPPTDWDEQLARIDLETGELLDLPPPPAAVAA